MVTPYNALGLAEASYGTTLLAEGHNAGGGSLNFEWSQVFMLQFCGVKYSLLKNSIAKSYVTKPLSLRNFNQWT